MSETIYDCSNMPCGRCGIGVQFCKCEKMADDLCKTMRKRITSIPVHFKGDELEYILGILEEEIWHYTTGKSLSIKNKERDQKGESE